GRASAPRACRSGKIAPSARAAELGLDRLIGARGGRELGERELEHVVAFLSAPVAAVRDTEVRDDLRLVLLVAELPENGRGFFEQADRPAVVAGMTQRQGHVALRQRDGMP